jgi:DNA-binding response OmpR family regulator
MRTGRSDVEYRIAGLDAGADDYLVKPFDVGELLARLRALAGAVRRSVARCSEWPASSSTQPRTG